MSSFRVISKKNRLKLGISVVIIIHIGFFYGFWHVKAGQIGNKVVNLDIYSAKAAEGLAFYESIPSAECVKVVNEQAPKLGMPVYVEPPADLSVPAEFDVSENTKTPEATAESLTVNANTDTHIAADSTAKTAAEFVPIPSASTSPATSNIPASNAPAPVIASITPNQTIKPAEVKLQPSLFYASAPHCKGVAALPRGVEKLGANGFVGLELNINTKGLVTHSEVSRSSGFVDLDSVAQQQVKDNWVFKPCQKGSTIVGCKQFIKFRWKTDTH